MESFGELWKMKYHFLGPRKFWKRDDFQNGNGRVLDFRLEKS